MTGPQPWEAPSPGVRMLQALVARLDTLLGMRQCDLNRLDVAHGSVEKSLRDVIEMLDKFIADVKAQIKQTIDDDPDLHERSDLLNTIPGLASGRFRNCWPTSGGRSASTASRRWR